MDVQCWTCVGSYRKLDVKVGIYPFRGRRVGRMKNICAAELEITSYREIKLGTRTRICFVSVDYQQVSGDSNPKTFCQGQNVRAISQIHSLITLGLCRNQYRTSKAFYQQLYILYRKIKLGTRTRIGFVSGFISVHFIPTQVYVEINIEQGGLFTVGCIMDAEFHFIPTQVYVEINIE